MNLRRIIVLLLSLCLWQATEAQTTATTELEQLQQEMYRYFSTQQVEKFNSVVERLKKVAQQQGDERAFYKAWSNQATYNFTHVSRQKGLDDGNEMRLYAQEHDSKYGLYAATYANGHMLTNLKQNVLAEKNYLSCLEYLDRYFPDESKAAIYLSLAKIYQNTHQTEKVRECAQKALNDPHASKMHKLNAMSYICLTYSKIDGSQLEEFNKAYAERKKMKEEIGQNGFFDLILDFEHALLNEHYEDALAYIEQMTPLDQKHYRVRFYEKIGNYKEALHWYKLYRDHRDSINVADARQQATEYSVELGLARTENEAKDLRLANQELKLHELESRMEQQRLEAESKELTLKNKEMELENATIQLQNATLDSKTQELKLREANLLMEAEQRARQQRRMTRHFFYVLGGVVMASLVFFLWRRQKQMKKLSAMHEQLLEAYDQLEETTTAKERIESELRIARDIQMSMVPSEFPHRPDLELAAYMKPAKEVGGDLYSFIIIGETLYFCIGDVSGKGVPASLFMAQATRLFRSQAILQQTPEQIANNLNDELSVNNEQGMFVTMFIGMANLHSGHLDFCNCGHNPPVLANHFMEMEANAPIGLWPGLVFEGQQLDDIRGQRLFLYTDGLNEAEDNWQNQFSDKIMLSLLIGHPTYDSEKTIEMFKHEVAEHVGTADPSDDLTMMCIKIK